MIDHYLTIGSESLGEYKDKGSKFIAYAFPMHHEDDLQIHLAILHDLHPKARHFCYAYRLGVTGERHRANDDGEPSGSAGKPILGQIMSAGLTHVLVVVIRYFGGTKLGVPGLITAYKESTHAALSTAVKIEKVVSARYAATFDYEHMGEILNVFKNTQVPLLEKDFGDRCKIVFEIRLTEESSTMLNLKAKLLQRSLDEVQSDTEIPFINFDRLT
jgi:uncharacterized YigZ family protein